MHKLSITKSNALIEAGYRLTITEMQIILYGISLINPLMPNFPLSYRIDISRFADMFNKQHNQIYGEIKEVVQKRFWERDFSYLDENGKIVTVRWLTKIVYEDNSGYIEIKFSEEIQPYLHQLQSRFTTYYIDKIAKMRSIYGIRFYEISIMKLKQSNKKECWFKISINEIKKQLEIEDKYKKFSNFKAFVLEAAKKEINEHSDIDFHYEIMRLGKTPYEIKIFVNEKIQPSKTQETETQNVIHKKLMPAIIEQAKRIVIKSGSRLDLYAIEQQFYDYVAKKGYPKNYEGAFIGFVKNKVLMRPS